MEDFVAHGNGGVQGPNDQQRGGGAPVEPRRDRGAAELSETLQRFDQGSRMFGGIFEQGGARGGERADRLVQLGIAEGASFGGAA